MTCTWIEDFLKLKTNLEKKVKMPQIQPSFVLKLTIHYKFGMTWTWTADFFNFNWETDLEKNKITQIQPDLFWNLQFVLSWEWHEPELRISSIPIGKLIWRKIKITQIQPRFVLKLTTHFKLGKTWTWTADLPSSNWETDLEKNQNNPNTTQICFETYNSF